MIIKSFNWIGIYLIFQFFKKSAKYNDIKNQAKKINLFELLKIKF